MPVNREVHVTPHAWKLAKLAEEATEVAEAASAVAHAALKTLAFGESDNYKAVTPREHLQQELRELIALAVSIGLDVTPCPEKLHRTAVWQDYARQRGIVVDFANEVRK